MIGKVINNNLFKATIIYTICSALNKSIPFLILPLLSYYLTPADYGIVANFNVFLSILTILITVGVDGAISVNYYKFTKNELKSYIFNALFISTIASSLMVLLVIGLQSQIYDWFKIPIFYQLLTIVMSFATVITTINLTLWRLEEKPVKYGFYEITQTILNVILSLIFVISLLRGWMGRVDGIIYSTVSYGLVSFIFLYKREYLQININKDYIKSILGFGIPLIPHALSFWIRSGVDRILISKIINETSTGLYATGFQFGVFISFITMAFNNAFVPYLYKNLSEQDEIVLERNKLKLVKLTILGIICLIFLCLCFTFFSNIFLKYFFNKSYQDASPFIFWAILGQTFQGMYLLFVNYLFFAKKTKKLAVISFSCSLLQIFISYFLIKEIGAIGAAYSTVIVSFVNFFIVMIYSNKVFPMPWNKLFKIDKIK